MSEDPRLIRLEDAVGRTGAALLALEEDPTVQLLDASALVGETACRWRTLADTRAALFRAHHELSDVVERARAARPREVAALLDGPSVVRSDLTRPVASRGLLDDSRVVHRCAPEQLLADMESAYAEVRAVVSAVDVAWSSAIAWADRCRERVEALRADARALDGPTPEALVGADDAVDALAAAALADPLGWTSAAEVDARLDLVDEELAAARALRDDWPGQLAAAAVILDDVRAAVVATDAAASTAASRILGRPVEPPDDPSDEMGARLDALAGAAGTMPWSELAEALAGWRAEVRRANAAIVSCGDEHRARLAERDELRSRLDAYEAKAAALGLLEDAELAAHRRQAHEALYTAPTDLDVAAGLVAAYADGVSRRGRP